MNQPYREAAQPAIQPTMKKENVGKITLEVWYKNHEDKIVKVIDEYVGSYDGFKSPYPGSVFWELRSDHHFTYAANQLNKTLEGDKMFVCMSSGVRINRERVVEMKITTEEHLVEYEDKADEVMKDAIEALKKSLRY